MAARSDPCPPALRDLRDVLVDALVARVLAERTLLLPAGKNQHEDGIARVAEARS